MAVASIENVLHVPSPNLFKDLDWKSSLKLKYI